MYNMLCNKGMYICDEFPSKVLPHLLNVKNFVTNLWYLCILHSCFHEEHIVGLDSSTVVTNFDFYLV